MTLAWRSRTCAAALMLLPGVGPGFAQAAPPADAAQRLIGRALGETPLLDDLRELCDRIGGRLTGSAACERAIEWAAEKFRAAGVESVALEPFTMPRLWLPGSAVALCVAPEPFLIPIAAVPFAPSTPDGAPLEAPLVDAGKGAPEDFAALGAAARGAIALIRSDEMNTLGDLFAEYMRNSAMLESAQEAGAAALLLQSTRPHGLLYRHPVTFNAVPAPLPVAQVERESAARLQRLLARGAVRVELEIGGRSGGPYPTHNVIAELRGREHPEEIVLLGAHLDSFDLGTGADDNGVNVALVIDVARAFRELGLTPRRTVRFALFTGEEQGMLGSAAYVERHAAELDDHVAVVIFDIGSGRTTGFFLNGREELRAPVERALAPAAGLGPFALVNHGVDGTDNFDFLLSGVPNLVALQDEAGYLPNYHAESDVFEMVQQREARLNAAIAASLVWNLAEQEQRLAPRQSRAQVEQLLVETGLDQQMKAFKQWDDWVAGRRGHH